MSKSVAAASGHALWTKMPKANAELFALTYGSLVTELVRDYEDYEKVNEELEKMGYSIGIRCVDEFLAKSEQHGMTVPTCTSLKDTAEVVAKTAFRMFLGISCDVHLHENDNAFSLYIYENPLALFCELPNSAEKLHYSNIYCGIIRGALEQVNLRVECQFMRDQLQGDDVNEIRVEVKEKLADGAGDDYKEE